MNAVIIFSEIIGQVRIVKIHKWKERQEIMLWIK